MQKAGVVGLIVASSAIALPGMAQDPDRSPPHLPSSRHIDIELVAPDVWAAVASDSGYAVANAAIVDLGAKTLVFDPFMSPEAAVDLRLAAEILTGRTVGYVALSHWHNDHIRGAQSVPGATIVATTTTRSLIAERGPPEPYVDWWYGNFVPANMFFMTRRARQASGREQAAVGALEGAQCGAE